MDTPSFCVKTLTCLLIAPSPRQAPQPASCKLAGGTRTSPSRNSSGIGRIPLRNSGDAQRIPVRDSDDAHACRAKGIGAGGGRRPPRKGRCMTAGNPAALRRTLHRAGSCIGPGHGRRPGPAERFGRGGRQCGRLWRLLPESTRKCGQSIRTPFATGIAPRRETVCAGAKPGLARRSGTETREGSELKCT